MAKLGFDHVRLSIDPMPLAASMYGFAGSNADFLARLDHAVDTMLGNGMAVIIDLHPGEDYKQRMRSDDQAVERFTMLWRRLAAHYADRDPNMVFFEILNEPEINDGYRWAGIQARVAAAIREEAPHHTIIAAGAVWSDIWDLLALHPLADGNVIYNFHFYEPHEFTHQGATWSVPYWSYLHGIPVSGDGELNAGGFERGSRCGRSLRHAEVFSRRVERASHPGDDGRCRRVGAREPRAADLQRVRRDSRRPGRSRPRLARATGCTTCVRRSKTTESAGRCGIIAADSAW